MWAVQGCSGCGVRRRGHPSMYACQLMVPCVDSALKSTKSSPRLGAVRGQGSGLRVSCAGSQWGACERKTREGLGAVRAHVRGEAPSWHSFA